MGKGKVYLTGAGPGDPKLITVKGMETIQAADVIVYDRLVSPVLLEYASDDAERIYVGKAPNEHTVRQEEINRILVEQALLGKTVTRLKGGDPFVFGRGGEEASALREHGIEFEIVPGVTSAIAVPAYAGIPVTHRGVASAFTVIAGCELTGKDQMSVAWERYAMSEETLLILMGIHKLPLIADKLLHYGKPAATPVALIRWGTYEHQEMLTGTLGDIVERVNQANFENPAVIVIGSVVGFHEKLAWYRKVVSK